EKRPHHRDHRPGRLLPRGAAAGQGLRGARDRAARLVVQHRPHRPPLRGPARGGGAAAPPLRRPGRRHGDAAHPRERLPGRGVQPRRAVARARLVRGARVHRGRRGGGRAPRAGVAARLRRAHEARGALLPGRLVGDVRRHRAAAARGHAVLPAQPVRRGEGGRPLVLGELPRGLRAVHLQRDPLQPREPAARRDVRHAEDHPRARPHPRRAAGEALPRQPRREARLGVRGRLRRGDVADAAAGPPRRLRRRDGRGLLGARVPRRGLRPRGARLARPRGDRPALLPPHRGRLPPRRRHEGAHGARVDAEGLVPGARADDGGPRHRARAAGADAHRRRAPGRGAGRGVAV
ncbi:MAG: GDP-mannose 4,6-dehydratase, partial [uncultured Gemmatimonadaceae bacterium]